MKKNLLVVLFVLFSFASIAQWQTTGGPSNAGHISSMAAKDSTIFAGTETGGIFASTDHGATWTARNNGLHNTNDVKAIATDGTRIFAGMFNSLGDTAVFSSTDNGANWSPTNIAYIFFFSFVISPNWLIAGTWDGVAVTTNHGVLWNDFSTGLPSNASVSALAYSGSKIFAGVNSSSVGGTGVFYSTNSGTSWNDFNTGLTNTVVNKLVVSGTNVFAGTSSGVFRSAVSSANWSAVNTGLTNANVQSFFAEGGNLLVGTAAGVFYSSNSGTNWTDISSGLPANANIYSLTYDSSYIYAGTDSAVYRRSASEVISGIAEKNPEHATVSVYPNPASGEFMLTVDNFDPANKNYEVSLFDSFGEEVLRHPFAGRYQSVIDISHFPPGMYFVKVTDDSGENFTCRIMKM